MQALEERVAFLEEELRRLQTQMRRQMGAVSGRTEPDFLDRFSGIFGDDPTFAEATRLGRAWREENGPEGADKYVEAQKLYRKEFTGLNPRALKGQLPAAALADPEGRGQRTSQ